MGAADRLRSALTENVGLKMLSFFCALLLYSLVHGSQDAQKSVSVDLVVLLPPESAQRVLVSQLPPRVRVTLRGSRTALDELHASSDAPPSAALRTLGWPSGELFESLARGFVATVEGELARSA